MYRINAEDIIPESTDYLWDNLYGEIELALPDGDIIATNHKEVVLSRYLLEVHNRFDWLPLKKSHFITSHMKDGVISATSHNDTLSAINKTFFDLLPFSEEARDPIDDLIGLEFEIVNVLYNELSTKLARYAVSVDIVDFIKIMHLPRVKEAYDLLHKDPNTKTIENVYKVIMDEIRHNPDIRNNALVKAILSKMVKENQALQCLGPRGYPTELTGKAFDIPIVSGYARGMQNIYELAADSRTGAKSLYLSTTAISDSEYFSRRLTMLSMYVDKIVFDDCGSEDYLIWRVRGDMYDADGAQIHRSDIQFLLGKYYLNEETGELEEITRDHTHLEGKTIKLRSVNHCKWPNKHEVCLRCFGKLGYNISPHANLGYISSSALTSQISQATLSTKHYVKSLEDMKITLTPLMAEYLRVSKDGYGYIFTNKKRFDEAKIVFNQSDVNGISDIYVAKNISSVNPDRISNIRTIKIRYENGGIVEDIPIDVHVDNRNAVLTQAFMKHIKSVGYVNDAHGNIEVPLTGWDFKKSFLHLPRIEYSFSAHGAEVAKMIETRMEDVGTDKNDSYNPDVVLSKLFDLVNSKLSTNLAILEVIIYAVTAYDPDNGNYDLARHSPNPKLAPSLKIMDNRSVGPKLLYEYIIKFLKSGNGFFPANRPDHPMDALFRPKDVVDNIHRKERRNK